MAILRMRKQTHGHHAKEEKLVVEAIQSIPLNTLACCARGLIQLEKGHSLSLSEKFFRARLCIKRAILCEGISYPNNQGARVIIVLR